MHCSLDSRLISTYHFFIVIPGIHWHRTDSYEREKEWEMSCVDFGSCMTPNSQSHPPSPTNVTWRKGQSPS